MTLNFWTVMYCIRLLQCICCLLSSTLQIQRTRSYCGLPLKAVSACMRFGGVCLALVAGPLCLCKCQRLCRYWLLCNGYVPLCSPTQLAPGGLLLQYCLSSDVHQTVTSLSPAHCLSRFLPLNPCQPLSLSFSLSECVLFRAVPSRCVVVHSE